MNARNSTTHNCENLADGNYQNQWERINWKEAEASINGLQVRIAKATKDGRWNIVKRLQYLLTHSFYAKALAVRTVTENKGKRTAGIDGEIWVTPAAKMRAILSLTDKNYKAKPLRRIYIPKPVGNVIKTGFNIRLQYPLCGVFISQGNICIVTGVMCISKLAKSK